VDELAVLSCIRERIDSRLVDGNPAGYANFLAYTALDLG
jgi:hypothetical protein